MASSRSRLDPLQARLLEAFSGIDGVWLTGGAALGGFHLGHRRSRDLDWFTGERPRIDLLARHLESWCAEQGLRCDKEQEFPGFRRYTIRDGERSTLVDLVHEPVEQVVPLDDKPIVDGVRIDPLQELVANKLAAILGRGETKDLVDLYFLADAGLEPVAALADASRKDAGLEPSTLAWVLSTVPVDTTELEMLEPIDEAALESFRDNLVQLLQRLSFPERSE